MVPWCWQMRTDSILSISGSWIILSLCKTTPFTNGKWSRTTFPFKGSMQKLNRIPIDKFTDNNILHWAEYVLCPAGSSMVFSIWGWEAFEGGKAIQLIGACRSIDWFSGILRYQLGLEEHIRNHQPGRNMPPFSYIIHDGSNNASAFCDFILQQLASGFYSQEISLSWIMLQSTISRSQLSWMNSFGTFTEFFFDSFPHSPQNWIPLSCCGTLLCTGWGIYLWATIVGRVRTGSLMQLRCSWMDLHMRMCMPALVNVATFEDSEIYYRKFINITLCNMKSNS